MMNQNANTFVEAGLPRPFRARPSEYGRIRPLAEKPRPYISNRCLVRQTARRDPSKKRRWDGPRRAFWRAMTTVFFFLFGSIPAFPIVEPDLVNVLGNPSFEQPIGASNPGSHLQDGIILGNWDNTPCRGVSTVAVAGAPDGSQVLQVADPPAGCPALAFTFQAVNSDEIEGGIGEGVFVTFSAFARLTVADLTNTARLQIEFNDAAGRRIGNVINTGAAISNAGVTAAFIQYTVTATAPAGTREVVFTFLIAAPDGGTTTVQFDQAVGTISKYPIVMDVSASKPQISKGNATYISSRIKNISTCNMPATGAAACTALAGGSLELVAEIPEGFHFIDAASHLDGIPVNSRVGSRIFNLGTIRSGESKQLGFLLIASSIVQIGKKYEVSFFVRQTDGQIRSATKVLTITITADPLFDEGTILGKVFDDQNENQIQDKEEHGVPGVKLATEQGIVVVTDPHGRYHIPAVRPGRHIVKIDGHTLPPNTKFVTEESVLTKTTEGMLNVVNFAVKLPEPQIPKQYRDQLNVLITQGTDVFKPQLAIRMKPDILRMGMGYLEEDPVFEILTNYADLVFGWRIEVRDEFGDEVWTGFGLGAPPKEAPWTGKTKKREPIEKGIYSYRLIVRDREGHEDWTPLGFFRVVSKLDRGVPDEPKIEVPAVGNMSIDRDGKRSIPMAARPAVYVRGTTVPWNKVAVNGESVGVNLDGTFQTELFVPPGKQTVAVTTTDPEGNAVSYQEEMVVKDSYFFMVALGEQELGANFIDGNAEVVGRDDRFDHGFYQDGRLAYYLKGKVKGKFLVTSRYDTDDPRRELFTNLDPDQYYPVYGDGSEITYDAYDTKQRFYILVEMDKSFLKWGSFHTNVTDTELATHNRTFSGLKIDYQTLSSTRYGDPVRGFMVYTADVDQLGDHNEFSGTGGSLFYLRNRNVIQGSEKVRMEVRDQIQNIPVCTEDLVFGADYEIDYPAGRIILRKPLWAANCNHLEISNSLSGNETFLIVDYEFDPQGFVSDRNNGIRGFTHLGDHFKIGGTAIEERRDGRDYDLRGIDLTGKFGRNTKVVAEYARSQDRTIRNSVSYNGGITFDDISTGNKFVKKANQLFDDALLIKAETKAKTGTEFSGYAQQIEPGFSNTDSIRQAGTRKAGVEVRQKAGEFVQLSYRFDVQKATDEENKSDVFVTSPEESKTQTVQAKADYDQYLAIAEYRNQTVDLYGPAQRDLNTALDDIQFANAVAGKFGYRVYPDLMPYAKAQTTWGGTGAPNHQFGGGVEAKVLKGKGTVRLEELAGRIGDSTQLSFDVQTTETNRVYTNFRTGPDAEGLGRRLSTTIGSSSQINAKSRFYSERELSTYRTGERMANIMGYDTKLTDKWGAGLSFERSHLYDIKEVNTNRNAGALEISYLDKEFLKMISRYELRYDGMGEDRIHWLFRDTIDWKINPDYSAALRFNRSDTHQATAHAFVTDGSFTELNAGLAYRPVRHNRLNVLTRYTWLEDISPKAQFDTPDIFGIPIKERAHIFGLEFGLEALPPWLGLVEKLAYRRSTLEAEGEAFDMSHFLWANRLNFHVARKWDLALEYRLLWDFELLEAMKHGALVELDREIMDYIRFGIGYNFTDFEDDLRSLNDFSAHGFFTRVSGKF